jgi:hypothetical protein
VRQLVAEAGDPETGVARAQHDGPILEAGNADLLERAAHRAETIPPVMIAEDRPHSERGPEACKFAGPDRRRNVLGDEPMVGDVIAEQDDEVGRKRVGGVDGAFRLMDVST